MSLRIRRGTPAGPPDPQSFGPTLGRQSVVDGAGVRPVAMPAGSKTTLVPANSVAANQSLINADATGVLWWPAGTYSMTTTGYSIPVNKTVYAAQGPLHTAADSALLTMSGTSANVVTITGHDVTWRGGIINGGGFGIRSSAGTLGDRFKLYDCEIRNAYEEGYGLGGNSNQTYFKTGLVVSHCLMHHCGRHNGHPNNLDGLLWEYTESHHGNDRHIPGAPYPQDESDIKPVEAHNCTFQYNYHHDNDGDLWFDTRCNGTVVKESVFENNTRLGMFIEDNDGVLITRNYMKDNGKTSPFYDWGPSGWYSGNILLARTQNTEISYNDIITTPATTFAHSFDLRLQYQTGGIYTLHDNWTHNNRFQRSKPSADTNTIISYSLSNPDDGANSVKNNRFNYNEYHVPTGAAGSNWFTRPPDGDRTFAQWQAGGSLPYAPGSYYDPNGTITGDL